MSGGSLASQLNERLCYEVHDLKAELAQLRKRNAELERRIAAKESMEVSYTDERGVTWNRPTAYAYAKACAALDARYEALCELLQSYKEDTGGEDCICRGGGYFPHSHDCERRSRLIKRSLAAINAELAEGVK